ncbi:MAG: EF-hand domain-containing protein [Bdellovibrionota bacterium]
MKISKDELLQAKQELASQGKQTDRIDEVLANFDTIDTDGNGISYEELRTYGKNKLLASGQPARSAKGGPSLSEEQLTSLRDDLASHGQSTEALDAVLKDFSSVDKDGDGKLNRQEFAEYAKAHGLTLHHPHRRGQKPPSQETKPETPASAVEAASLSAGPIDLARFFLENSLASGDSQSPETLSGTVA